LLKHLGATYYQTLNGNATATDVARAVEAVARHSGPGTGPSVSGHKAQAAGALPAYPARKRRVRDVMTTDVLTVSPQSSYRHTARLLHDHHVSAVPVLSPDDRVAGLVSEADLLTRHDRHARHRARLLTVQATKASALTAADLMTAPAITIGPDAPAAAAAGLMHRQHLKCLPVVDADGNLIGILTRHDLLAMYLPPDDQIAAEVAGALTAVLLLNPSDITVTVCDGVVTLSGEVGDPGQIRTAIKLADDVDGVIAVTSKLTSHPTDTWSRLPG
jgi:CBS domain-containing protein